MASTSQGKLPQVSAIGISVSKPSKSEEQRARARASKALANAKQRCTNKNNPDYARYGGLGILMLFKDVHELLSDIGLPKVGLSLDRIDPSGHYEVGNVRWATAAVQAANKKSSYGNAYLGIGTQIAHAKEALALRENRKHAAVGWVRVLLAFNEGHLPRSHAEWLADNLRCSGLIEANFDFDTAHDWLNDAPGYVHLPALALPKARIRIRSRPAFPLPAPNAVTKMGRLAGLEGLPASWNVPISVWNRVRAIVAGRGNGVALYGMPNVEDLLGGWIEGASLAMASCVVTEFGLTSACYPLLRVQRMLDELGSPEHWEDESHPLLDAAVLFIPDLSLNCGVWGEGASIPWWKVGALLRYRYDSGHQTIVGVQTPSKLPRPLKEMVLGAFELIPMPRRPAHSCAEMKYSNEHFGVPSGSITLRDMRLDPGLRQLAIHSGLIGT